ncbi:MAG TPA: DUF4956 domain-containing protein [Clostridiaceae bacterium]|jgi:uncharacterized membrane protein YhiD involved in acid resistance|nr:DUF4956 domain-containing protein [Clostridiaceae bacterium]
MTFQDIFKSSFIERFDSVPLIDMTVALLLAFCLGLFIFFIYAKSYTGIMYSPGFGVTLIALAMITTLVMLAVTSNIVLSLGMVGALSIVRFRTAIKEPMDIAFLFWSIAAGIVLAAGLIILAVIGSLLIGAMIYVFAQKGSITKPYILVVRVADEDTETRVLNLVRDQVKKTALKSKSVGAGCIELNLELRLKDDRTGFVNEISALDGVAHVAMVSYNGDYLV